jgi:hypothetical protein
VAAFQAAAAPTPAELLPKILERVSEEAEVFFQAAPRMVGQETLVHKGRRAAARFKSAPGAPPQQVPVAFSRRELVSEFGFGSLKGAPEDLRELRQVVKVDGRAVAKAEKARQTLAFNMASEDDRARKRMLETFEKHGLVGAAMDFAQAVLLFRRASLATYEFEYFMQGMAGLDTAWVFKYRQKGGEGMRVYGDKELARPKMAGELWVRRRDHVPLKVTFAVETKEHGQPVSHQAEVDYIHSALHGILLPSRVQYTRSVRGEPMVENVATYSGFRMFKADADIKFTAAEEEKPR